VTNKINVGVCACNNMIIVDRIIKYQEVVVEKSSTATIFFANQNPLWPCLFAGLKGGIGLF